MGAFVFLGAFKVNAMRDTSSVNIGTQLLIGLQSESTSKMGGSQVSGDFDPVNTPTELNANIDNSPTNHAFSDQSNV
ncbi:hypothetical protein BSNK01_21850 [Bacillaceae bacterium]